MGSLTDDLLDLLDVWGDGSGLLVDPKLPFKETEFKAPTKAEAEEHCASLEYKGMTGLKLDGYVDAALFGGEIHELPPGMRHGNCGFPLPQAQALRTWLLGIHQESKDRCESRLDSMGFK